MLGKLKRSITVEEMLEQKQYHRMTISTEYDLFDYDTNQTYVVLKIDHYVSLDEYLQESIEEGDECGTLTLFNICNEQIETFSLWYNGFDNLAGEPTFYVCLCSDDEPLLLSDITNLTYQEQVQITEALDWKFLVFDFTGLDYSLILHSYGDPFSRRVTLMNVADELSIHVAALKLQRDEIVGAQMLIRDMRSPYNYVSDNIGYLKDPYHEGWLPITNSLIPFNISKKTVLSNGAAEYNLSYNSLFNYDSLTSDEALEIISKYHLSFFYGHTPENNDPLPF